MRERDPSHRHLVFRLHTIRRLKLGRSVLRRMLYRDVLNYLFHGADDHVDISMRISSAERPFPADATSHRYFAYKNKRVVGPTARLHDTDEEDLPAALDGTAISTESGCLFSDSHMLLKFFVSSGNPIDPAAVFAFANFLRQRILDRSFDWHASTPPDHQGIFISGPDAYRLLLPRLSTRQKIDREMFRHG